MAKRFTDTEKWKKQFIKSLSTVHKLFFLYLLDSCDHAGIWHVEMDIASIRIGCNLDIDEIKKIFGKYIHEFDNGEKWFIPYFIEFQYGVLNPSVNAHKSVMDRLNRYKLVKIYEQFVNSSLTVKDKDMDKDIDKDKIKFKEPSFSEFSKFFIENGYSVELAKRAWNGYNEANWHDSNGKKIKNWKQKAIHVWFRDENKQQKKKDEIPFITGDKPYWVDG